MDDSLKHAGAWIGQSDPLIIISRLCYGGYSPGVKAVLDRTIGVSLSLLYLAGRAKPIIWGATRSENCCAFSLRRFYGMGRQTAAELCRAQPAQPWIQNSGNAVFPKSCRSGSDIMKLLILNASPKKRGGASQFSPVSSGCFFPALSKKRFLCGAGKTLTMRFPSWAARTPYVSLSAFMWMDCPLIW